MLWRDLETAFVIVGQDSDRCAFLERDTLENYLPTYHSSGCYLHTDKDTPMRAAMATMTPNKTKSTRPAATDDRQVEGPYRRIRLNTWLGSAHI